MNNSEQVPNADQCREEQPVPKSLALKIGVMGGAGQGIAPEYLRKSFALGESIALAGCITVTGACPGLPLQAALGASKHGGMVIGISPALSLDEHAYRYQSPTVAHDVLIFTGSGLMGREVVNIRSSDIVTIVGGSSGTLGELAIAYDEGKLIGVLTGTGGISDMVESILKTCNKNTGAQVIYNDDPVRLIEALLDVYRSEHFRHPSVFCREEFSTSDSVSEAAKQDPVCGMSVEPGTAAARRTYGEYQFVFCSLNCVDRYDLDPQRFVVNQQSIEQ
jgi:uncharacterized protein (TIGR00725 family)